MNSETMVQADSALGRVGTATRSHDDRLVAESSSINIDDGRLRIDYNSFPYLGCVEGGGLA